MARIAALSGAGSFSQAVTTWDSSGLNGTEVCESLCESPLEFPCKIWRREGDSNPRKLIPVNVKSTGDYLLLKRIEADLTQPEVAKKAGVSARTVRKWEHDHARPSDMRRW